MSLCNYRFLTLSFVGSFFFFLLHLVLWCVSIARLCTHEVGYDMLLLLVMPCCVFLGNVYTFIPLTLLEINIYYIKGQTFEVVIA